MKDKLYRLATQGKLSDAKFKKAFKQFRISQNRQEKAF